MSFRPTLSRRISAIRDPEDANSRALRTSRRGSYVFNTLTRKLGMVSEPLKEDKPPDEPLNFTMGDPLHDEETPIGRLRNLSGAFVNNFWVQVFTTTAIISNSILLGVMTLDAVRLNPSVFSALEWFDISLLIVFTIEFTLQIVYLGPKLIGNSWIVFDGLVVFFSWIFLGTPLKVFRAFRIFRIFSLASKWTSMQELFAAVGNTVPKMGNVAALLALLFYVFMVLCTSLFSPLYDEGYLDYDYFGRLDLTLITLFQMLTTDSWLVIVRQVMDKYNYSYLLFFGWVTVTSVIVINIIMGIICESLVELKAGLEEAEEEEDAVKSNIPLESLIHQQAEITRMQVEMEMAINSLILRLPVQSRV